MPLSKLVFKPGVNREGTVYSAEGQYYASDKIRFRSGFPEKIGGWMRWSNNQFTGIARNLINWVTLSGLNLVGVGTHLKYMIGVGGSFTDITPLRATSAAGAARFAAVNGSTTVTVTHTAHGALNGDFVTFSSAVSLGGALTAAILNLEYQITYLTADTYTITTSIAATAGDVGDGGAATVAAYQIHVGLNVFVTSVGWSAGSWPVFSSRTIANPFSTSIGSTTITFTDTAAHGLSTNDWIYFLGIQSATVAGISTATWLRAFQITSTGANTFTFVSPVAANATAGPLGGTVIVAYPGANQTGWGVASGQSISNQLRLWGHDTFGEDLVFNVRGGSVYYFDSSAFTRGVLISSLPGASQAPTQANQILISQRDRHVIAFGSNNLDGTGAFDPLQIRWSDAESAAIWNPLSTNSAGDLRISSGSYIVTALQMRQEILIWTDCGLHSMQYVGASLIFGVTLVGNDISIIGPNAVANASGAAYWMGVDKFYVYTGTISTLPCTLRQYIFDDLNFSQAYQIFASTNKRFNEIWWFYPSKNSTTIDKYVIFNYLEDLWYYGTLARTALIDSSVSEYPIAADYNSRLLNHECQIDDQSGTVPIGINAFIESSDFDIGDGENFAFINRIIPDMNFLGSTADVPSAELTLIPRISSGSAYSTSPVKTMTVTALSPTQLYTDQLFIRIRGRQLKLRIESRDVGVQWQLGAPRLSIRQDGKKV